MSSVLIWSIKFIASVRSFILIVKDLLRYSFFDVVSRSDFGRFINVLINRVGMRSNVAFPGSRIFSGKVTCCFHS